MKLHSRAKFPQSFLVPLAVLAVAVLCTQWPVNAQEQAGWRTALDAQESVGGYDWMSSVEFLNRRVGWAVGLSYGRTAIFRTQDGGQTWERVPLFDSMEHPPKFQGVRFWDANHGWIASSRLLLRTSDGGESWVPVEVPQTEYFSITRVLPLGPNGVVIGRADGWIRATTDGGQTWHETKLAPDATNVTGLAFVSPQTIFAVTASPYLNQGRLYRSDDGGRNWERLLGGSKPLGGIAFSADGLHGAVVGVGVAYWTADGGATWKRALFAGNGSAVRFLDETTVVGVSRKAPKILISRNGGKTWNPGPDVPGCRGLSNIAAVDGGWWFASGGYEPGVYHYVDPEYVAVIAGETLELSEPVVSAEGTPLPPGTYWAELAHVGFDDTLTLDLLEPAEGIEIGVQTETGELGPNQYACELCTAVFPVAIDYELFELEAGQDPASLLNFSFEPTEEGFQLNLEAVVAPPHYLAGAFDLLGLPTEPALNLAAGSQAAELSFEQGAPAVYRVRLNFPLQVFKAPSQ